jgi:hypothetical protein
MNYYMGIDLARKKDWTVATVIDGDGRVVAMDRFHQVSWALQVERCAILYRTFCCSKATVDSTGLGDVVIEQLEAEGLVVEAYIFTVPSRRALLEELILAFDNVEIQIPNTEKFQVFRSEIEAFEYTLDGTSIKYEAPSGTHDDCVFSLALAVHCWHGSRSSVLGVIENLKRLAAAGKDAVEKLFARKPEKASELVAIAKPVERRVAGGPPVDADKPEECPACKMNGTIIQGAGAPPGGYHCNQCSATFLSDGTIVSPATEDEVCAASRTGRHIWKKIPGKQLKCDACAVQKWDGAPPNMAGMSRAQYAARNSGFREFGRFGR